MSHLLLFLAAGGGLLMEGGYKLVRMHPNSTKFANVPFDEPAELRGEVKTVDFESKHLGEVRQVKAYLPPGHDPKKRYPVAYVFDSFEDDWPPFVEELITTGKVPPLIVVGTAPGANRFQEYVPGSDPETFEAHEKFFIQEVLPWAEKEWGASKERKHRVVCGSSNSGPCALYMSTKYVALFGHVIAFQIYACPFDDFDNDLKQQKKDPTCYKLVVGGEDAHGIEENEKVEELLKAKKFPVSSSVVEGYGHSRELCRDQLPVCLREIFGKKK